MCHMNRTQHTPTLAAAIDALWSGAVADAIGNTLEFMPHVSDAAFKHAATAPRLHLTDDTQMTLFLWESLLNGTGPEAAYKLWYTTQVGIYPSRKAPLAGLIRYSALWSPEAPGTTCMSACRSLSSGHQVNNDSKGNGTVMRASPFAFYGLLSGQTLATMQENARADADLTHKHPYAAASSVMLVNIIHAMRTGYSLLEAMNRADCPDPYVKALVVSMINSSNWSEIRNRRAGWVAEEALAMACGAALRGVDFLDVVRLACNGYSCDSDTIASIAGQLAALNGMPAPEELRKRLVAKDAVRFIEARIIQKFSLPDCN